MKSNFALLNFTIASIYAIIYDYVYCNYIYNVWITYADGSYIPMNDFDYVTYIFISAFPFIFYKGLKYIASAFSLFVYVFVYIPFIESLFVNGYPDYLRIPYSIVFLILTSLFFLTDRIYILKSIFKKRKRLFPFKYIIILTYLLLFCVIIFNRGQMHFVNFFSDANDLYSLRSDTNLHGIYFVCWIRAALLPLLLVYYLNRKSLVGVLVVIIAYLLVFMMDKQKLTIIFPLALIVIYYSFVYYKENFSNFFHVFLLSLFAIVSLILTNLETTPVILTLGMLIILRIQCIAGLQLERYLDFFVINDNPYTYYTHISIINKLTGLYPYGSLSIGQAVAGDGGNSNAAFWLMDGIAGWGIIGCIIISIIFIFFKSLMNSMDSRCSVGITVTILLFGIQSMVNMSLMTAILTNGFFVLFLLFFFLNVGTIENPKLNTYKR